MVTLPLLSVQLWSVRQALAADMAGTLVRLAHIGLERVEPFDIVGDTEGLKRALAQAGLSAPSAHAHLTGVDLDRLFAAASALGVATVIEPMIGDRERWTSFESIQGIAQDLGKAAEKAAAYGVRIGYHNHAFELENTLDGRTHLEVLAGLLHPSIVLELDTYWAAVGGQDVPALLGRLGDRVRLLHLKDGPISKVNEDQLPLGGGRMPVWDIVSATPALELPVLEFDGYRGDMFEALRTSFEYATAGPLQG